MSATTWRETPCWEIVNPDTGEHPNEEVWPHHATREEAEEELSEWDNEGYQVRQSFDAPCRRYVCDGCSEELDASGDGWTHFDPNDSTPGVGWGDIGWIERDGKHYHDDCAPRLCEECGAEGHDVDDCERAVVSG